MKARIFFSFTLPFISLALFVHLARTEAAILENSTVHTQVLTLGTTERVSISSNGQANGSSSKPSMSDDGRYVAFNSTATNLVSDTNGIQYDIFVYDRLEDKVSLVSVDSNGIQSPERSWYPSISGNGRLVAFESQAGFDGGISYCGSFVYCYNIFVHDRQTHQTKRATIAWNGGSANGFSSQAAISANGRYVAFTSEASNLVQNDGNTFSDIFVRDILLGQTIRASISYTAGDPNGYSKNPAISADGRYVAFSSSANNLVQNDTTNVESIFVYDLQTNKTISVSVNLNGVLVSGAFPTISASGRYVAFESADNTLVISDTNGVADIFVRDLQTNQTFRVSVGSTGNQGNGKSSQSSISDDGCCIAFTSLATNLVVSDTTNLYQDIFVHNRQTGKTFRASVATNGDQGNWHNVEPSLSGNGQYVAFASPSTNLVSNDTNGQWDSFVYDQWGKAPIFDLPYDYPGRGLAQPNAITSFQRVFVMSTTSVVDHSEPGNPPNHSMIPYLGYSEITTPTSQFPCQPSYHCYDGHDGYDFGRPLGSSILAPTTGTVTVTWGITGYYSCKLSDRTFQTRACTATIDHGNGFQTVYLHLKQEDGTDVDPVCRIGAAQVNSGEPIGQVGMTGCTDGPHIHFGTRFDNRPFDPSGWLDNANADPWAVAANGNVSHPLWLYPAPEKTECFVNSQTGGNCVTNSNNVTVTAPAAGFNGVLRLVLTEAPVELSSVQLKPIGHSFMLEAYNDPGFSAFQPLLLTSTFNSSQVEATSSLSQPFTIVVYYDDSDIGGLEEDTLSFYFWNKQDNSWVPISTTLDLANNAATANTNLFGLFALLANDNDIQGPVIGQPTFNSTVFSNEALTVTIAISDTTTGNHGIAQATLYYSYTVPYTQTAIFGIRPSTIGDGNWIFTIPPQGEAREGSTFYFSISAKDGDLSPIASINNNDGAHFSVIVVEPQPTVIDLTTLNISDKGASSNKLVLVLVSVVLMFILMIRMYRMDSVRR